MTDAVQPPAVAMLGISKAFGRVTALRDVDLELSAGEVHAVVGENGAGKSTLMHILAGVTAPDAGRITVGGRDVPIGSVADAHRLGIAMVHQHFMLFPSLSVAENLTIGQEPYSRGLYDRGAARRLVAEAAARFGLAVDPDARVADLSVGALQRVEILRALLRRAEILILDEPTAILTPRETAALFDVVRGLAREGRSVVFVTHRLSEVLEISARITVLRDGHVTARLETARTNARTLARAMVGRDIVLSSERPPMRTGGLRLELRDLSALGLSRVSLRVHAGEIVGVAGVAGNGQTELAEAIVGLHPTTGGSVIIDGRDVTTGSVAERRAAGLAYIPDDRYRRGLALDASVGDNLVMGHHTGPGRGVRLDVRGLHRRADQLTSRFGIRTPDRETPIRALSGGNAQRVVLARELADARPVTIASQPTRGIDVAATEFVYRALVSRRNEGGGVLLISSDLDEIRSLADRIVVLHAGRIVGELTASEADDTRLGLLMAGVSHADNGYAAEPDGGG